MTLKTGLLGRWPLDERSSVTVVDEHGSLNGALTGAAVIADVASHAALDLTAGEGSATLSGGVATNTGLFTVSFWVWMDASVTSLAGQLIGQYGIAGDLSWRIWFNSSLEPRIAVSSDGTAVTSILMSLAPMTPGWNHYAIVMRAQAGNNLFTYINAVQVDNRAFAPGTMRQGTANLQFMNGTGFDKIALRDVRIWTRDISAAEVSQVSQGIYGVDRAVSIRPPSYKQTNIKAMSDIYNRNLPEQYEYLFGHDIRFYQGGGR